MDIWKGIVKAWETTHKCCVRHKTTQEKTVKIVHEKREESFLLFWCYLCYLFFNLKAIHWSDGIYTGCSWNVFCLLFPFSQYPVYFLSLLPVLFCAWYINFWKLSPLSSSPCFTRLSIYIPMHTNINIQQAKVPFKYHILSTMWNENMVHHTLCLRCKYWYNYGSHHVWGTAYVRENLYTFSRMET